RYQTFEDGTNNWETATYPRLTTVANDNNWRYSTYWAKNISYVRLKNIELGYNFPKQMLEKVKIYGLRVYAKAMNAAVFSNLDYFDPEDTASGISSYPFLKTFNFGVQVKF
ncbi:MAG: TonB-dependent receptor, partial [Bacteroidales bacterium]|nr:TonB-dependent receptor [Bacteroidales bacterium]